ncbi:CrcB family protein [Thioalkalivibrio sulfidiphilus]|uniref:fluoride efflux transporter FluC n=1 Tax=Thioalkalivibrio sulfidiphilus TaxID=1033854 RepID=UPI000376DD9F
MPEPVSILGVALGSALGAMARHGLSQWVARHLGEGFPWGTWVVNLSGAFALGLLAGVMRDGGGWLSAWLIYGFLGSYTTVSTFSLQTLALARDGHLFRAGANVFGTAIPCVLAAGLGVWLGGGLWTG